MAGCFRYLKKRKQPTDVTPNTFTFNTQSNVALSIDYISNTVTILGINTTANVTCSNCTVSINGGAYVSSGTITNGKTLTVKVTSPGAYSSSNTGSITVGTVTKTFTVSTVAAPVPTQYTFSPTYKGNVTLANDNRTFTPKVGYWQSARSDDSIGSNKVYAEFTTNGSYANCGLCDSAFNVTLGTNHTSVGYVYGGPSSVGTCPGVSAIVSRYGSNFGGGNIGRSWSGAHTICIALNGATRQGWIRLNGTAWAGGGDPSAGTSPSFTWVDTPVFLAASAYGTAMTITLNTGQAAFNFTPPDGFA